MHQHSENRRSFLGRLTFLLGVCAAALGSWGVARFAFFGSAGTKPREFPAEILDSLQDGAPTHVPEAGAWLVKGATAGVAALDDRCTHLGCRFRWDAERQLFACPCHGSEFSKDGTVVKGPATRPLTSLEMERDEQGKVRLVERKNA